MVFEQRPLPELNALPMAQLRLLWAVRFHPGSTMKDLSERLGVSQSSVTELANRLVRRNLIARLPDPEDRRVIRLSPSDFGREILERADAERRAMAQDTWDRIACEEQPQVLQGLQILARAAEAVRAERGTPLPPMPDSVQAPRRQQNEGDSAAQPQSVVDIMARRVRGR
jgi:DNA-binding MarR family transcriptional regulator